MLAHDRVPIALFLQGGMAPVAAVPPVITEAIGIASASHGCQGMTAALSATKPIAFFAKILLFHIVSSSPRLICSQNCKSKTNPHQRKLLMILIFTAAYSQNVEFGSSF
jgi:hypothetical protein